MAIVHGQFAADVAVLADCLAEEKGGGEEEDKTAELRLARRLG